MAVEAIEVGGSNASPTSVTPAAAARGPVHRWYQTLMTFEPEIVGFCLFQMDADGDRLVLDPFCGTGTTLVECAKLGFRSIGMDASPMAVLASRVKSTFGVSPTEVDDFSAMACERLARFDLESVLRTDRYARCIEAGIVARRWISQGKLNETLALLQIVDELPCRLSVRRLLKLCALTMCVDWVANVRFGPELYRVQNSRRKPIADLFSRKTQEASEDLRYFQAHWRHVLDNHPQLIRGDARDCGQVLADAGHSNIGALVTSPPYPNEHDYTRNTRIELVLGGFVGNQTELRSLKKCMLRSSTKGIYSTDSDSDEASRFAAVRDVVSKLERRCATKTHGFARLYPRVVTEYFGGMMRHMKSAATVIDRGAKCAYVVGEQRTYLQVRIQTAEILGHLASATGLYRVRGIETWRTRIGSTGTHRIDEKILYLERK